MHVFSDTSPPTLTTSPLQTYVKLNRIMLGQCEYEHNLKP